VGHLVGEDERVGSVNFDGGAREIFSGFEVEDVAFYGKDLDAGTGFIFGLSELRTGDQGDKNNKSFKRFHFDFLLLFSVLQYYQTNANGQNAVFKLL
jgi:hypothetical protein